MTTIPPGSTSNNSDRGNAAARGLTALAIVLAIIGAIFAVIGFNAPPSTASNGVEGAHDFKIAVGLSLVGSAFTIWVILLVFWAWRYERRNHPAPSYQVDLATGAYRFEKPGPERKTPPPSIQTILATAAKSDTALAIQQLGESRIVTVTHAGQALYLVDDLAAVMETTVAAITKVGQQYGLAAQSFNYALDTGPDAVTAVGHFLPARALPSLLKRIPAARGPELLAFAHK